MPFVKQAEIKVPSKGFFASVFSSKPVDPDLARLPAAPTKFFAGRADEQASFVRDVLAPTTPRYNILSISGEHGIGKTELLRQLFARMRAPEFTDYCLPAYVNEMEATLADIMEQIAAQLRMNGDFRSALDTYRRLEAGRQSALEATKESLTSSGIDLAASFVKVPLLEQGVNTVVKPAVKSAAIGSMQENQQLKDAEKKRNSIPDLTRAFVDALNRLAATQGKQTKRNRRIVLFFDAFEKQASMLVPWLLNYLLPLSISDNVVLVVAAPLPLDQYGMDNPFSWASYVAENTLHFMPLRVFNESETREYLAKRGHPDANNVETILQVSGGLPVALQLLANRPDVPFSETMATVVDTLYLQGLTDGDPKKLLSLSSALFSRPFNRDDIDAFSALPAKFAFLPAENNACNELYGWLTGQDFLQPLPQGRYTVKDYVQSLFNQRLLFNYGPDRYFAIRQALASYYEQLLKRIQGQKGQGAFRSPEWAEVVSALVEQLFLLQDQSGTQLAIEYILLAGEHLTQQDIQKLKVGLLYDVAHGLPSEQVTPESRQAASYILQYIVSDLDSDEFLDATVFLLHKIQADPSCPPRALALLYRDMGISYVQRLEYKEAVAYLNQAEKLDSGDPLIYSNRGLAYLITGAYQQAIEDMDRAIERGFQNNEIEASRGLAAMALGKTDQALQTFNAVLASNPDHVIALTYRAILYQYLSEFEKSIADLDNVLKIDPDHPVAHVYRGFAYLSLHDSQRAIADLNAALAVTPDYFLVYLARGIAYALLNESEPALADLNHAVDVAPDLLKTQAYTTRSFGYYFLNKPQEAFADCQRALALDPNLLEAYTARGFVYNMLNQPLKALQDFQYVLDRAPTLIWATLGRGAAYLASNQYAKAIPDFDTVIQQAPSLARAYSNRGMAYALLNNFEQALTDSNRALSLDDKDALAYASRGFIKAMMNRPQEAIEDCQHALALSPNMVLAYIGLGQAYIQLDDMETALHYLNQAIEQAPRLASPYAYRGFVYALSGRPDDAIKDCQHAIELTSDIALAHLGLGIAYAAQSDAQQALEHFNRAVDIAPIPFAYLARGRFFLDQQDLQHAIEDFEHVTATDPALTAQFAAEIASAYFNLGIVQLSHDEYAPAVETFNKAIQLTPDDADTLASRGEAHRLLKKYSPALEDFDHALQLNPNDAWVLGKRGLVYSVLNDYPHAIEDFSKAIELSPDTLWLYYDRADAYSNAQDYAHAIADFNKWLESAPDDAWAYAHRGDAYLKLNDYQSALKDFDLAIRLKPDYIWAYGKRGHANLLLNQHTAAIQDYSRAIELGPDSNTWSYYNDRGLAYADNQDYPHAIADFSTALTWNPGAYFVYIERGNAYLNLQDNQHAIEDFSRVLATESDNIEAHLRRGVAYLQQSEYDNAIQDYTDVLKLDPANLNAYAYRSFAYVQQGEYQKALDDVNRVLAQEPDDLWLLAIRATASLALNNLEQAGADYARCWQLQPADINVGWMTEWIGMCQKTPGAETAERLAAIADVDPDHPIAFLCRGAANYLNRRLAEAATEIEQSIAREPENWDGHFWAGLVAASSGKDQEAKTAIEKALALKLPPVLLTPLRWLEQDQPAFYKDYAAPLLARYPSQFFMAD